MQVPMLGSVRASGRLTNEWIEEHVEDMTLKDISEQRKYLASSQFKKGRSKTVLVKDPKTGRRTRQTFTQQIPTDGKAADVKLPRWATCCVEALRGTCFFRTCIAREPETPLTPLHLTQPIAGVLTLLGLVFMAWAVLRIGGHEVFGWSTPERANGICLLGQAAGSCALLFAGLHARRLPSNEALNVRLARLVGSVGQSAVSAEDDSELAEQAADMSISRLQHAAAEKSHTRLLRDSLRHLAEERYEFKLKKALLRYLWQGEEIVSRQAIATLELRSSQDEMEMSEYRARKAQLLPDGALSVEELEAVVEQVSAVTTTETINGVLAEVLQVLVAEAKGLEAADGHSMSYARIFQFVQRMAGSPRFKPRFDEVLKVDGLLRPPPPPRNKPSAMRRSQYDSACWSPATSEIAPASPATAPPGGGARGKARWKSVA